MSESTAIAAMPDNLAPAKLIDPGLLRPSATPTYDEKWQKDSYVCRCKGVEFPEDALVATWQNSLQTVLPFAATHAGVPAPQDEDHVTIDQLAANEFIRSIHQAIAKGHLVIVPKWYGDQSRPPVDWNPESLQCAFHNMNRDVIWQDAGFLPLDWKNILQISPTADAGITLVDSYLSGGKGGPKVPGKLEVDNNGYSQGLKVHYHGALLKFIATLEDPSHGL
ncbi:hypothetical protein BV22DRAFT_1133659 [Leucogyrophana mollusca]|uniref:Uncharacterized protein n=1 Tax=Leucogyrophana mollusca TaxID=85980 RepID=A0ACB8B349_9AGAM|nr:hypothetical protein BV22DRAFT_1133659 [Leucogyrophana mollusca]